MIAGSTTDSVMNVTLLNSQNSTMNDNDDDDMKMPASMLADEKRAQEFILHASIMEERPVEIIDRPNGEEWEKIAQGCARAGVFPCSGSEGRGTRPDQDYCFGDLSYGNCIGIQCNNPGVTPLIFGNSASSIIRQQSQQLFIPVVNVNNRALSTTTVMTLLLFLLF